jgi:ribonuclease J
MQKNVNIARNLGYLEVPEGAMIKLADIDDYRPEELLILSTGSQGEPLSALSMISLGEHRDVAAGPGDTVVLSARAIPGNERTVSRLISNLFRLGCDVVHPGTARSTLGPRSGRTSWSCCAGEAATSCRAREYRMLAQHAQLAVGPASADRVLVAEDGDVLSLRPGAQARRGWRPRAPRPRGRLGDRGPRGARPSAPLVRGHRGPDHRGGPADQPPRVPAGDRHPRIVDESEAAELAEEAGRLLSGTMDARPAEERLDASLTRERVRDTLRRFYKRRTQRRPMVIPVVMEV